MSINSFKRHYESPETERRVWLWFAVLLVTRIPLASHLAAFWSMWSSGSTGLEDAVSDGRSNRRRTDTATVMFKGEEAQCILEAGREIKRDGEATSGGDTP
jgi:hypothetical protein